MKLLIFSSEFPPGPGGIGTHAFQLARYFSAHQHYVLVLSPQDYVNQQEKTTFNNQQAFEIRDLSNGLTAADKALRRTFKLLRAMLTFKPDIVLVSGGRSIWIAALVLALFNTPWVVVGHGTEFGSPKGLRAWLTKTSCDKASAVICVSNYTRQTLHALGVTRPQITVIHNGADSSAFYVLDASLIRTFRQTHAPADAFILLTVGNVSDRKGQECVIRALPAIVAKFPNILYWMAGLPQEQPKLAALAAQLGVSDKIIFWGRVDSSTLLTLYNSCDLFVMTSRQLRDGDFEGYGIAVVEAALCGKASLVSDNSGLAEAVLDGVTGVLVPQNDPSAIASTVLGLVGSSDLLKSMGISANEKATHEQTWEQVGQRYDDFIQKLISNSR